MKPIQLQQKIRALLVIFSFSICLSAHSENYLTYYHWVSQAEVEIVDAHYDKAFEHYQNAIQMVANPFAKDYYNAALCAAKTNHDSSALAYIEALLKKGISIQKIQSPAFKHLYKTTEWQNLKSHADDYRNQFLKRQNKEVLKSVTALLEHDQDIRKAKYGYPMSDTIAYVDSMNMVELKNILQLYLYPDENMIGLSHPKYFNPPHYTVIRHHYQTQHFELTPILYESMIQGKLSPRVFAELEDRKSQYLGEGDTYGTVGYVLIKGREDSIKHGNETILKFNENRKKIGLESWEDYLRKIQFQESQKEFYFGITEGKMRLGGITWKEWLEIKNQ